MPQKKKKFPRGTKINAADFFGMHYEPAVEIDSASESEKEDVRNWLSERERQKTAAAVAVKHAEATKQQIAVSLHEEHNHRTIILGCENNERNDLEETICDQKIRQEWIEYQAALQQEAACREIEKKVASSQLATQQMLHRADIAEKETKERISFLNNFMRRKTDVTESKIKHTSKQLESDRKKAAERAKAYEIRMRQSTTQRIGLFKPEPAPLGTTAPAVNQAAPAKEAEKKGGWWPW
jgi:hypothetical protein